jgi:hypothetical protein
MQEFSQVFDPVFEPSKDASADDVQKKQHVTRLKHPAEQSANHRIHTAMAAMTSTPIQTQ